MAYKKLIKVSNVCQLLDKRKYNPSQTRSGITWTNNGDGSWTANGIAEANFAYANINQNIPFSNLNGHIIYICIDSTNLVSGVTLELKIQDNKGNDLYYRYNIQNEIINLRNISSSVIISISAHAIYKDIILENYTFKPQLFDLTEMYGAGHEPTTVEQFRQDFPEEMYDYSPHCWLTSYKRVIVTGNETYPVLTAYQRNLTCKTKNLLSFPYYSSYVTKNGITFSQVETYKVHASGINTNTVGTSFDFIYNKVFKAGTYTIKFYTDGNVTTDLYYRIRKDNYYGTPIGNDTKNQTTFTLSEDTVLFIGFGFTGTNSPLYTGEEVSVTVWCQIEEGDTATDYVPYGHL